jgi:hypothetical protein
MNTPDILAATTPVVEAFEQLGVPYHVGGSVASSLHGIPRLTIDVDLVADLRLGQVRSLVKRLEAAYYIDEDMILDAIRHRSSFAVIHLGRGLKVDVFIVPKNLAFYCTRHIPCLICTGTVRGELPSPLLPLLAHRVYLSTERRSTSLLYASAFTQTSDLFCNQETLLSCQGAQLPILAQSQESGNGAMKRYKTQENTSTLSKFN